MSDMKPAPTDPSTGSPLLTAAVAAGTYPTIASPVGYSTYSPLKVAAPAHDPRVARTQALQWWWRSLANRFAAPVDIIALGHSFVEGQGASVITNRWQDRLLTSLRARYQPPGVVGGRHYKMQYLTSGMTGIPTSFVSDGDPAGKYGLGTLARFANATGAREILTGVTCTDVDIIYTMGGGGTFATLLDSVNKGNTNTTGAVAGGTRLRVPGLGGAPASHNVEADFVSGNSIIEGFYAYNGDTNLGVRMWDSGHSGATTDTFLVSGSDHWWDNFAVINPALVLIQVLANDFKTGKAPSASLTNLQAMITKIRAQSPNASIVLVPEWALGNFTPPAGPWTGYIDVYQQALAADPTLGYVDVYNRVGTATPPTLTGVVDAVDRQHPTDLGHQLIADIVAEYLFNG